MAIQIAGCSNEALSKIGVDAPVALFVGIGQSTAGHFATKAHVVQLGLLSPQTGFDITEAFTISKLGKC